MGSTRLPGKILLPLEGANVLQHIIKRLKRCKNVGNIVLATTTNEEDDVIAEFAENNAVNIFRGSQEDVLSRYYNAAVLYQLAIVIRVTSDCPVIDHEVIDSMVTAFLNVKGCDYMSNTLKRTFPRGLDAEIFTFNALASAYKGATKQYEKEHVTPYIYQHKDKYALADFTDKQDNSEFRITLDTAEDYELIKAIYERIYPKNPDFSLKDVIELLKTEKDLTLLNRDIKQKGLHD